MFQANVHLAATGSDPVARWRGRYKTAKGMRRVMGPAGLLGCVRQVARARRWKRIPGSRALIGDIGLAECPTGVAVVRKLHRNAWIGRNDMGWSLLPTDAVRVAWSVA
jgi:hypothetical protein